MEAGKINKFLIKQMKMKQVRI